MRLLVATESICLDAINGHAVHWVEHSNQVCTPACLGCGQRLSFQAMLASSRRLFYLRPAVSVSLPNDAWDIGAVLHKYTRAHYRARCTCAARVCSSARPTPTCDSAATSGVRDRTTSGSVAALSGRAAIEQVQCAAGNARFASARPPGLPCMATTRAAIATECGRVGSASFQSTAQQRLACACHSVLEIGSASAASIVVRQGRLCSCLSRPASERQ